MVWLNPPVLSRSISSQLSASSWMSHKNVYHSCALTSKLIIQIERADRLAASASDGLARCGLSRDTSNKHSNNSPYRAASFRFPTSPRPNTNHLRFIYFDFYARNNEILRCLIVVFFGWKESRNGFVCRRFPHNLALLALSAAKVFSLAAKMSVSRNKCADIDRRSAVTRTKRESQTELIRLRLTFSEERQATAQRDSDQPN